MHVSEYREAFDPETRASRRPTGPRSDVPGIRAHGDTPPPTRPKLNVSNKGDEWSDLYRSPIHTPDWNLCRHLAIRETSIGGVLTNRSCIDCGTQLPDRQWDD